MPLLRGLYGGVVQASKPTGHGALLVSHRMRLETLLVWAPKRICMLRTRSQIAILPLIPG